MTSIARFEIKGELGRGGGGVVYRCLDPQSNTMIAVKVVAEKPPEDDREREAHRLLVERLRREADSMATLEHPNIVKFIEFGEDQDSVYFAMELVQGYTLEEALQHQDRLPNAEILRMLSGVASALDFAHSRGIVHRDVKPDNVMVTADGGVKVMDFGTAKLLQQSNVQQLTMLGSMIGSAHYMSPEQITEAGVTGQSDQFSLGIIAYVLLAGRRPFEADSVPAVLFQITSMDPPAVASLRSDLSSDVDTVLRRALAKSRESRYPTCAEFVRELGAAMAKPAEPPKPAPAATAPTAKPAAPVPAPVRRTAPAEPAKKPVSEPGLNPTLLIGIIAVVVVVLIVILIMARR